MIQLSAVDESLINSCFDFNLRCARQKSMVAGFHSDPATGLTDDPAVRHDESGSDNLAPVDVVPDVHIVHPSWSNQRQIRIPANDGSVPYGSKGEDSASVVDALA